MFIAPNEKMKQVLKKTVEEAKAIISKVSSLNGALKLVFGNTHHSYGFQNSLPAFPWVPVKPSRDKASEPVQGGPSLFLPVPAGPMNASGAWVRSMCGTDRNGCECQFVSLMVLKDVRT